MIKNQLKFLAKFFEEEEDGIANAYRVEEIGVDSSFFLEFLVHKTA